jgi:ribosomal protein S18 acetylase RimI-like enzyme
LSELTLRLALPADVEGVKQVVDAAYSTWIPVIGMKPRPMLADYPALIERGFVHVMSEGERMIAVLVIWTEGDALYIDNIAVHPDHQRRGIANRLLDFAEQQARERGFSRLTLMTNEKMAYNQAYYLKHGFAETQRALSPDGRRVVSMEKPLT